MLMMNRMIVIMNYSQYLFIEEVHMGVIIKLIFVIKLVKAIGVRKWNNMKRIELKEKQIAKKPMRKRRNSQKKKLLKKKKWKKRIRRRKKILAKELQNRPTTIRMRNNRKREKEMMKNQKKPKTPKKKKKKLQLKRKIKQMIDNMMITNTMIKHSLDNLEIQFLRKVGMILMIQM